ncbi:MAG TPA: hypothetical protein VGC65_05525 [Bacteroidia bacterium]|jgi:hypothetical protein
MKAPKTLLLITGLLSLFWSSCSPEVKQGNTQMLVLPDSTKQTIALRDITNYFEPKADTFNINPSKDTLIKCLKGTMLYLPANSLQYADGRPCKQLAAICIKECYSLGDFVGNNLSTGSGDKLLETAGMVNITASENGKPLTIKKGKEYALYFPKKEEKKDMQLFYGNHDANGQIDWSLAENPKAKEIENKVTDTATITPLINCKIAITGQTVSIGADDVLWNMKDSKETIFTYFLANFPATKEMENEFCSANYRIELTIKLSPSGKVSKVTFKKESKPEYDKIITDFLYQMAPLDIATMAKYAESESYSLFISGRSAMDKEQYNTQFKKKYASFKDKAIAKIDKAELNYYVETATKFGWINCDRFWNTKEEKIEYFVSSPSPEDTKIIIVFKNINCIMQGTLKEGKASFDNIPVNQDIKVIGISCANGKPNIGIAKTTTGRAGFALTEFKEVNLDQLEKELNTTN